jgi:hypothetical protein
MILSKKYLNLKNIKGYLKNPTVKELFENIF